MGRKIDEDFIEEAVERYRRLDELREQFDVAVREAQVTVTSSDGLVEVVVGADGAIRDVSVVGSLAGRTNVEVSRSIRDAVGVAADAATWARARLHDETFGGYRALGDV